MSRVAYVSHSKTAQQMLCVWLDKRPTISKDQRDPDAWTSKAPESDYAARRLAELAHAPNVTITWIDPAAAEWWCRIEGGRRRKVSAAERARTVNAQPALLAIPEEIEREGRIEGAARTWNRGKR